MPPLLTRSDTIWQIEKPVNGKKEIKRRDIDIVSGEFNKFTVPFFLTIGKEFKIGNKTLIVGLKGYYGMNKVIKNTPNSNHYYGLGFSFGLKI